MSIKPPSRSTPGLPPPVRRPTRMIDAPVVRTRCRWAERGCILGERSKTAEDARVAQEQLEFVVGHDPDNATVSRALIPTHLASFTRARARGYRQHPLVGLAGRLSSAIFAPCVARDWLCVVAPEKEQSSPALHICYLTHPQVYG